MTGSKDAALMGPHNRLRWDFDTAQDGTIYPVRLNIAAGTSKATVIRAFEQMRDDIDQHWPTLISHPDEIFGRAS